ncbi:DUF6461 domain-containing protein [Streptomyces sp. SID3343]|uniref:DUF6461 domain-containing protein n=1 Tax=Streptomyces sp. SID3343 TaxID=2690260 RepID=UPI00137001DE|nr:DUF6461 domain-containing protein [Streptomyces sp. SID3343]MYV99936.1 hypothetical protein [Streptomyces sp. SID3343]
MSTDGVEWLEDSAFDEFGYCVTFARGLSAVELLRRMGCDTTNTAGKTPTDANHWIEDVADEFGHRAVADKESVIRAGEANGWAFAVEDAGIRGIDHDVLAVVSTATVAMSTFRNVNALTQFLYVESGKVVCAFESAQVRDGTDPDRLVPYLTRAGLLLPDGDEPDLGIGERQRLVQRMMHTEFGATLPREDVENGELLAAMY